MRKTTSDKITLENAGDDKVRALQNAMSQVEKNFGKGSVIRLGDGVRESIAAISTGSLTLDTCLGIGGIPKGRITEIYGPESGGKTTLSLHCVAEAQRAGEICLFIDAEHALDVEYAKALGVDVDKLYLSQPSSGEEALEIADTVIKSGAIGLVVIDSVAALVPKAEIEGEMGDSFVGLQARMMSQALRKLGGTLNKSNTACIFINQIREKIGVMYGNPETTPGGRALKFWASVRLEVRKGDAIKIGTEQVGTRTKVKVVKNKLARNIVSRSGTFYNYGEQRIGQGRDNARTFLEENESLFNEIDVKLREIFKAERANLPPVTEVEEEEPEFTLD